MNNYLTNLSTASLVKKKEEERIFTENSRGVQHKALLACRSAIFSEDMRASREPTSTSITSNDKRRWKRLYNMSWVYSDSLQIPYYSTSLKIDNLQAQKFVYPIVSSDACHFVPRIQTL